MAEWDKKGVPHKGWKHVDVIDIMEDVEEVGYEQCEMCGNEKLRYVHIMEHPEYKDVLRVGCVCAEKMSEDYDGPRVREQMLRNRSSRRTNFNRVEWRYNPDKGTYSKKYKGENITILKSKYGNSYGIYFSNKKIWEINGKKILTLDEAKKTAFVIFEKYHTTKEERNMYRW